jgi:D-serine deaminase-like pyridoxal phosphate-dependent protein
LTSLDPNDAVLSDIDTPALVVEAAALDANIERMQAAARGAGISLRPHAKTHKSPDIARRQRQAGAIGIGCASLREAEDMSAAGLSDVLITSPVVGRDKLGRVVALHRRSSIMLVVDHPSQVDAISTALGADDLPVPVLLDVDVGQARTGIVSPGDAVALARQIRSTPRLRFAGLQGYAGHIQHIIDARSAGKPQSARRTCCELFSRLCVQRTLRLKSFLVAGRVRARSISPVTATPSFRPARMCSWTRTTAACASPTGQSCRISMRCLCWRRLFPPIARGR